MPNRDPIEVDITDAIDFTKDMDAKSRDASSLMDEVADIMHGSVMENFDQEEGSEGPWPELAEATNIDREEHGYDREHPMLIRSRGLQTSILPYSEADQASVISNKIYGPIHNFGGKAGRGRKVTIPRREFMWLRDEDAEEIDEAAADFFSED